MLQSLPPLNSIPIFEPELSAEKELSGCCCLCLSSDAPRESTAAKEAGRLSAIECHLLVRHFDALSSAISKRAFYFCCSNLSPQRISIFFYCYTGCRSDDEQTTPNAERKNCPRKTTEPSDPLVFAPIDSAFGPPIAAAAAKRSKRPLVCLSACNMIIA